MTDQLIEKLDNLASALRLGRPSLWTTKEIAAYFNVGVTTMNEKIICRPDFPKAIKITDDARGKRWQPDEVIAWAKQQRDLPKGRNAA